MQVVYIRVTFVVQSTIFLDFLNQTYSSSVNNKILNGLTVTLCKDPNMGKGRRYFPCRVPTQSLFVTDYYFIVNVLDLPFA